MFVINKVKRYRIITFIKNENAPRVIKLRGNMTMLKTGLSSKNIKASAAPPIKKAGIPPEILTPGINNVSIKRDDE
ncbi:MAG: hypothetical protein ACD_50C00064G0002 [uncultured bacterium]|nr:MAG: hypothetical protein ACD_50C00064G0002 [uncultured bacterium]